MTDNAEQTDTAKIQVFLVSLLKKPISKFRQLVGGERSKAYFFKSEKKSYVLRISSDKMGFEKDSFAAEHFSKEVPIPKIITIGIYDDRYYAISNYLEGDILSSEEKYSTSLLLSITHSLDLIHQQNINEGKKYGIFNAVGKAEFNSWSDWVLKDYIFVKKSENEYFKWNDIYTVKYVDQQFIKSLFKQINKYLIFIPEERGLLHGDFANGNIIYNKDKQTVTGVIDWSESAYGDPLYDVAWFDFWIDAPEFKKLYKQHSVIDNGENFEERILCHQLFIGLHTLGIYAAIDYKDGYNYTMNKIKKLKL